MGSFTFDIESTGLLNSYTIDYTSSPYKLKPNFKIHCVVFECHKTGDIVAFYDGPTYIFDGRTFNEGDGKYVLENYAPLNYTHYQMSELRGWIAEQVTKTVGHNIIDFDLLACKLVFDMDFTIEPDTWDNKSVEIVDTLVLSKVLNPDRFGGHSLDEWGKRVGKDKIQFRKHIPESERFLDFAADMLYYCIRDVQVNTLAYAVMELEGQGWDWSQAIQLEKQVGEIVSKQSHRGFKFDSGLAQRNLIELDALMEERRQRVEPLLPPKPATKGLMDKYTPPAKQFLKTGEPNKNIQNFLAKHGWRLEQTEIGWYAYDGDRLLGKLPLAPEPMIKEVPATIDDTSHIKGWLVSLGWVPSEWAIKDITVKTDKSKKTREEVEEAVNKYLEQTMNSPFRELRLDECEVATTRELRLKMQGLAQKGRPIKVPSNPKFTKGQEKEICPNLLALSDKFPYAKDIVEYLTYRHRRNSILGGGVDWEDYDEEEDYSGFLSNVREDGRIATPADTCGTSTSRMKHRVVANVPRVTSLYGENLRGLFGIDTERHIQIGYDFASLEAGIEGHYCWKWEEEEEKPYCKSLVREKPNDVHTITAKKISEIIGRKFERTPAKSVKYCLSYGGSAPKVAKTIGSDLSEGEIVYKAFWEAAKPLAKLRDALAQYWETAGQKKFVLGIDGRKVPTRAKHALVNSLFQSAGVICAKKVMVLHDRKLKAVGLSVDFFKDDWKNKQYCQQLIAYHDESQLEATKNLLKFKLFKVNDWNNEEEVKQQENAAKEYRKTLINPSAVGHSDKGYFVATSVITDLLQEAVEETTKHFKLNVPLAIEWIVGQNWSQCH